MVSHFVGTTHFFVFSFSFSLVDVPAETHGKKLTLEHKGTRTAAKRRLKRQLAVDQVFENLGAERERGAGPAPPEAPLPFVSAPFPDVSLFLLFLIFFFFFLSLSLSPLFFRHSLLLPPVVVARPKCVCLCCIDSRDGHKVPPKPNRSGETRRRLGWSIKWPWHKGVSRAHPSLFCVPAKTHL